MTAVPETTYVDYVMDSLQRIGEEVALKHADRDYTGEACIELIHALAAELSHRGLKPGDGVCILSGNRPEAFLLQQAVLHNGGFFVGLHPLGSADDQKFILDDCQAKFLVYDPHKFGERAGELESSAARMLSLGPGPVGDDLIDAATRRLGIRKQCVAAAAEPSGIWYTGGTTGTPKGVVHTHRSSLFQALSVQANWQWPRSPRLLVVAPITHAAGQMIAPALAHGGQVLLTDGFDPESFLATIEREQISAVFVVPTMLYALLDREDLAGRDLASLELLIYGAAPMSNERLIQAKRAFGPVLYQGYGQAEIGIGALNMLREEHDFDVPGRVSVAGRAPAGTRVAILDDDGVELGVGATGEICFRSTAVMAGYLNQPDLTATTLRGGWLHTGDVGFRDPDGFITIVDRSKDMIVSGGFNVYPKEIEDALHAHPDVALAAVVGLPDARWGEAVHAVVVPRPGAAVDHAELKAWVKTKKGPIYAPKTIEIVDALPTTPLGKIDKKAIRSSASVH